MQFIIVLLLLLFGRQQPEMTAGIYYTISSASEQASPITLEILEQAQTELAEQGLRIDLIGPVGFSETSAGLAGIQVYDEFDSERIIVDFRARIFPNISPLTEISSILKDGLSVDISLLYDSQSANVIASIVAYAAGDCGLIDKLNSVPNAYRVNFYRANCALMHEDFEQAILLYSNVLHGAGGEYRLESTTNLAWAYLQIGKEEDAFTLMDAAVERTQLFDEPTAQIDFLRVRSQLYALAFRYDEAIADMDAAIALEPNNARLYVERGQRILLLYEWDRALADYNRALELDPDYADAYYFRGVLYASVPEGFEARQAALDDFQQYLALMPEGEHAEDAARYITEIQAQLDVVSSP